jgi:hypothetical protein
MYAGTIVAIAHHISSYAYGGDCDIRNTTSLAFSSCTGIKGADPTDLPVPNQICGLVTCPAAERSAVISKSTCGSLNHGADSDYSEILVNPANRARMGITSS